MLFQLQDQRYSLPVNDADYLSRLLSHCHVSGSLTLRHSIYVLLVAST